MNARLAMLLHPLVLGFAGCGASPAIVSAPIEPPHASPDAHPGADRVFLWTVAKDGARVTSTLDTAGSLIEHQEGVRIAARGNTWQWTQTSEPIPTEPCPQYDGNGNEVPADKPSDPGKGDRVTLVPEHGTEKIDLVHPEKEEGAESLEEDVELLASVGSYLFIRRSAEEYTCGAHGSTSVRFFVYDVESRAVVWASDADKSDFVSPSAVSEAEAKSRVEFGEDDDVTLIAQGTPLPLNLTEVIPSYGIDARVEIKLQFTAGTCYACSDGAWSSYTKSTTEPLAEIPSALRPWQTPSTSVMLFVSAHPELTVGGWSRI